MIKSKLTPILHWPHDQFVHQDICSWWVTDITDMITFSYSVIVSINVFPQQLIEVVWWPQWIEDPWWSTVACRWNLWEPSWKLRPIVIIRHVLSHGIYTFKYINSDDLFYTLSTEGARLLKLLLQLYHQFLHEGKTGRCNIQNTSRLKLKGCQPT